MIHPVAPFKKSFIFRILLWIVLSVLAPALLQAGNASGNNNQRHQGFRIEATRWEDAEKIFRSDPRWLGGDGATSIDLGNGRVLWLFGDSFVDPSGSGIRRTSDLVRNTIAVQTGYDPARAEMAFFWKTNGAKPAAFFDRKGEKWYWPGSGIMVGKRLLIFLMEIHSADNELGFDARGWKAVFIKNPQEIPDHWLLTYLISPQKNGLVVGTGNPIIEDGFLKAFATDGKNNQIYLVRWPVSSARAGTLTKPQWLAGNQSGWVDGDAAGAKLSGIIPEGQMEFTVEYVPKLDCYLQVQTLSIVNPCLAAASVANLTGPWSSHTCFYSPTEQILPDVLIYAGKSHPMLLGADMAFTYVVNTIHEDTLLKDMSIYVPVFLKGLIITDDVPHNKSH